MSELTDWLVRHITLVVDNDQYAYTMANEVAREVLQESGVTLASYRDMSEEDRAIEYAGKVGERVCDWLDEQVEEALPDEGLARMLVREFMPFGFSDVQWEVGKHYLPEVEDVDGVLDEDEEDESDVVDAGGEAV